ncbi:hypothetical protein K439DRAFT_1612412 [Ramaria rubella]|nr:hypothetical protein K439DRAFT_1612412 [Ramaria rubella]
MSVITGVVFLWEIHQDRIEEPYNTPNCTARPMCEVPALSFAACSGPGSLDLYSQFLRILSSAPGTHIFSASTPTSAAAPHRPPTARHASTHGLWRTQPRHACLELVSESRSESGVELGIARRSRGRRLSSHNELPVDIVWRVHCRAAAVVATD